MTNPKTDDELTDHDYFKTFFEMCVPILGALQDKECDHAEYLAALHRLCEWLHAELERIEEN